MNNYMVVMTTFSNPETGNKIINTLLSERLAACIQAFPIKSCYSWKGSVARDDETLLFIKAKAEHYGEIEQKILSIHDYETPEIIAIPIQTGFKKYTDWMDEVSK